MEFYLLKLVTISFYLVEMLYIDSGLPLAAFVIISKVIGGAILVEF